MPPDSQIASARYSFPAIDLDAFQSHYRYRLEQLLESLVSSYAQNAAESSPHLTSLADAISYSSLAGGKRIRAILTYMVSMACSPKCSSAPPSGSEDTVRHTSSISQTIPSLLDSAAIAVELIHCYSLIHDDLPAMDDDDIRRGKPSCHIQFGEANAILAGDALQTLAFEVLSHCDDGGPEQQLALIKILSNAAGMLGMVGGQAIDLAVVDQPLCYSNLVTMHQLKTGALISAAVKMGAVCANANPSQFEALACYADNIGLAFQVQDDILDIESSTEQMGKPQGTDQSANKPTFPSILGLEEAKAKAQSLCETAIEALSDFGTQADLLRALAIYIIQRKQ